VARSRSAPPGFENHFFLLNIHRMLVLAFCE
jgi:hypothetical protein